jgi:hypothetical protein
MALAGRGCFHAQAFALAGLQHQLIDADFQNDCDQLECGSSRSPRKHLLFCFEMMLASITADEAGTLGNSLDH